MFDVYTQYMDRKGKRTDMGKGTRALIGIIVLSLILGTGFNFSQEKQDPVKRAVDVLNVELIVRAMLKGKPLAGLKA